MQAVPKRMVIKIGTSTLTHKSGALDYRRLDLLARAASELKNRGCEIILVSSGAISVGVSRLGLKARPSKLRHKQASAAVGQCRLMRIYDKFFEEYGHSVGQILLTRDDVDHPARRENLHNTFESLLEMGVMPIVNENDSVGFEEIEAGQAKIFGDNDTLSAIVAVLLRADLLVLLSDIDGLFDADPHADPDARKIARVTEITDGLLKSAGGAGSSRGTGGMVSKLSAASIVMDNNIDMIIANGDDPRILYNIYEGEPVGTLFSRRI